MNKSVLKSLKALDPLLFGIYNSRAIWMTGLETGKTYSFSQIFLSFLMRFILRMQIQKFHAITNYLYENENSRKSYKHSTVVL